MFYSKVPQGLFIGENDQIIQVSGIQSWVHMIEIMRAMHMPIKVRLIFSRSALVDISKLAIYGVKREVSREQSELPQRLSILTQLGCPSSRLVARTQAPRGLPINLGKLIKVQIGMTRFRELMLNQPINNMLSITNLNKILSILIFKSKVLYQFSI